MTADRTTPATDVCTCGHALGDHAPGGGVCLERDRSAPCGCQAYRARLAAQAAPAPAPAERTDQTCTCHGPDRPHAPHQPCDRGCQPDWHRDDCAVYLPPAPAERTEAQSGVAAVLAGLLDNVLGNVFNDFHSDRDLIDSEDVRNEFAAALAAAEQGTTQPAPASRECSDECWLAGCLADRQGRTCPRPDHPSPGPASDDAALRERVLALADKAEESRVRGVPFAWVSTADLRAVVADTGVRDA